MGRFLTSVLRQPPMEGRLKEILALLQDLPMGPANLEMLQGSMILKAYAEQVRGRPMSAEVEALRHDYSTLFDGPFPIAAPPWESAHIYAEPILFGFCTREVRRAYDRWGLGLAKRGEEPEDHIGLELAFLIHLTRRAWRDAEAEAERAWFLEQHLLKWIRPFCLSMVAGAETGFYRGIAWLLLGYVLAESTACFPQAQVVHGL